MADLDYGDMSALLACCPGMTLSLADIGLHIDLPNQYISITLHCIPVQAYWDKSIKDANCGVNEYQWYLGNVVSNFVLNLVVLILPMLYIKKLQVERSKKLAVAGMFTFGSL